MKKNKLNSTDESPNQTLEREAEVLFQKIFNKWYAFTTDGDECYMTEVKPDEIQERKVKKINNAA